MSDPATELSAEIIDVLAGPVAAVRSVPAHP